MAVVFANAQKENSMPAPFANAGKVRSGATRPLTGYELAQQAALERVTQAPKTPVPATPSK
jgi:hypothetical protein